MLKPQILSGTENQPPALKAVTVDNTLQSLLHELHAHCKVAIKWLEEGSLFSCIGCDSLLARLLGARVWRCVAVWEESGDAPVKCLPCVLSLSMHRAPV